MTMLLATTYGNGPYRPTIIYKQEAYQVGQALDDIHEALQVAVEVAQGLRDGMRSPGYDEYLARLGG